MDYVPLEDNEEHWVPKGHEGDHCAHDFCDCKPVLRPYFGRWLWMHNLSDDESLLEQAENIRIITSIQIWSSVIGQKVPHQIIPFPCDVHSVTWPQAAKK